MTSQDQQDTHEPAKPEQVFMAVWEALRRQFGSASHLDEVSVGEESVVFGFTVDGVDYSLSVNRTP